MLDMIGTAQHMRTIGIGLGIALVFGAGGYGAYALWAYVDEQRAERDAHNEQLAEARADIERLTEALESLRDERDLLADDLRTEQNRNQQFANQIADITGTVGQLDKLSRTDPELLKKYSKVYFLNEHYAPAGLVLLDDAYVYNESREHYILREVRPFLEDMIDDAKADGVDLWVVSAFRSFDTQAELKAGYTVTYGAGANAFSADQGYSEHQLGTTVDFTSRGLGGGLNGFAGSDAYTWLTENAHRYGFILSYPEGNDYYIFEPWHWRFVGRDLARDLHRDGKHFYDVDQRTLDAYLISLFD